MTVPYVLDQDTGSPDPVFWPESMTARFAYPLTPECDLICRAAAPAVENAA